MSVRTSLVFEQLLNIDRLASTSASEPVDPQSNSPHPTFVLTVKTTDPIWFYCQQGANTNASHCGKGMVGAVNTDQSKFDQFKQKALAIGASLSGNSTSAPTIHQVSVSNAGGNLTYTPPVTVSRDSISFDAAF